MLKSEEAAAARAAAAALEAEMPQGFVQTVDAEIATGGGGPDTYEPATVIRRRGSSGE